MNDTFIIVLVVVAVIIALVIAIFVTRRNRKRRIDTNEFIKLLKKEDIKSIDYIRNKISITFKTLDNLNTEKLIEQGAKKISIVGHKVKFYVSEDVEKNKTVYQSIKQWLEG